MNEARRSATRINNNSYGTRASPAITSWSTCRSSTSHDFNERIIRGYEEGHGGRTAGRLCRRPVADPRRHRRRCAISATSPREIPEYTSEQLHRLHGLRHRVPGHRHPRQGARRGRAGSRSWRRSPTRSRPRACSRKQFGQDQEVLRRPEKKGSRGGMFDIIIDPTKCKGCAECVTRLRRRRARR